MNNKIKILGSSAFIATGMVPLGATQIFANEINPTQVEERNLDIYEDYDIDENEEIDDSEIIPINDYVEDYQSDNNQESQDNSEDIDENEDELLIGQPKSNDTPKTSDAGVVGYIGVIIASIGGLFAVIRKMI